MYKNFLSIIEKRGITPYRVAKDTGISQVTLCDWKYGRSIPKVDKLKKIADYLNVSLESMIKEDG